MINSANIILTHNCNLRCKHCYIDAKSCKEDFKRTYEDTIKLLNKLYDDGFEYVMFTGGECTVFPYLKELIVYAKKIGLKTSIFTNGMIFDKEILSLVNAVNISLDGPREIHNYIRNNKNSYDNIIKILEYLNSIDKKTNIQITVSNINIDELDFLPDLLINYLNVRKVNIEFVLQSGRAIENNICYSEKDIEIVKNKLNDFYEKTKYHIQFKLSMINQYDFENYYLSGNVFFPVWFDIPNKKYYILDEEVMKDSSIENYSIDTLYDKQIKIIHKLNEEYENIIKDKFINVESLIIKLFRGNL